MNFSKAKINENYLPEFYFITNIYVPKVDKGYKFL